MIDKNRIIALHAALNATLKEFAEDNGLSVSPFNVTYSLTGFKCKLEFGDKSELGDVDPVLASNVRKFGQWYGLSIEDCGQEFSYGIDKITFCGLKNKNTAIYMKNGQRFRTDVNHFAKAIGRGTSMGVGRALGDFGA